MSGVFIPIHGKLGEGFSKQEKLKANEHPGRNIAAGQTAASWIMDLVSLRKPIILCNYECRGKFRPKKHNYRVYYSPDWSGITDGFCVNGKCDACKQDTVNMGGGAMFISEETYSLNCIDPREARRRAREKWAGSDTAWSVIAKLISKGK